MMFGEGEHGHSDVGKYEVLGQEVEKFEQLFGPVPGVGWKIVVCVVRLADTAE